MKIKKGDKVKVIAGKFKGLVAEVVESRPREDKVVVEGVNIKKRSLKKTESSNSENFVFIQYPIHVSNVRLATEEEAKPKKVEESVKAKKGKGTKAKGEKKKSSKSK